MAAEYLEECRVASDDSGTGRAGLGLAAVESERKSGPDVRKPHRESQ